ncbi:MAG TPA: trehalose-phosphatase, partial [Conexibacter sp.]|nr:trehalose-phosphatase [Conexibacter sp.]
MTPARPTAGASDARLADALSPLRSDPSRSAVLLDVDGTLAPIVRYAEEAHVPEGTRSLLIELARRYAVVACVSGRRASDARRIVSIGTISYLGSHGTELLRAGCRLIGRVRTRLFLGCKRTPHREDPVSVRPRNARL